MSSQVNSAKNAKAIDSASEFRSLLSKTDSRSLEVAEAMALLSDGAFKLFIWLCLHAKRSRGALASDPKVIARALGNTEAEITTNLSDLFQVEKYAAGCLMDGSKLTTASGRMSATPPLAAAVCANTPPC